MCAKFFQNSNLSEPCKNQPWGIPVSSINSLHIYANFNCVLIVYQLLSRLIQLTAQNFELGLLISQYRLPCLTLPQLVFHALPVPIGHDSSSSCSSSFPLNEAMLLCRWRILSYCWSNIFMLCICAS